MLNAVRDITALDGAQIKFAEAGIVHGIRVEDDGAHVARLDAEKALDS